MAHLYIGSASDSLYLDVTAGDRSGTTMRTIADGVFLHLDERDQVVGIEVRELSHRGGLQVDDLDSPEDQPRPAVFAEIERLVRTKPPGDAFSE